MKDLVWLLPSIAAGLLVLSTHIRLGRQVLARGIVFIDLAIAQTAAVGVLVGESVGGGAWVTPLFASGFAVAGAALVAYLSVIWPARREALIGLLYVGAASVTIFWVSSDANGTQRLSALLSGDVLWTTWSSLMPLLAASLVFWALSFWQADAMRSDWFFYPAFAVLVSFSLPLLGLYLVFVSLIVPALWVERTGNTVLSSCVAVIAFISGIMLSYQFDWPTGTIVVITLIATLLPLGLISKPVQANQTE